MSGCRLCVANGCYDEDARSKDSTDHSATGQGGKEAWELGKTGKDTIVFYEAANKGLIPSCF